MVLTGARAALGLQGVPNEKLWLENVFMLIFQKVVFQNHRFPNQNFRWLKSEAPCKQPLPCVTQGDRKLETSRSRSGIAPKTRNEEDESARSIIYKKHREIDTTEIRFNLRRSC